MIEKKSTLHKERGSAEKMKKKSWKIARTVQERQDGQKRWNRAYLLVLEIAQSASPSPAQEEAQMEVDHASSNLCPGIDSTSGPGPNH